MGYVPPPNLWKMTDEEVAAWARLERRRRVAGISILAIAFMLFAALVAVIAVARLG